MKLVLLEMVWKKQTDFQYDTTSVPSSVEGGWDERVPKLLSTGPFFIRRKRSLNNSADEGQRSHVTSLKEKGRRISFVSASCDGHPPKNSFPNHRERRRGWLVVQFPAISSVSELTRQITPSHRHLHIIRNRSPPLHEAPEGSTVSHKEYSQRNARCAHRPILKRDIFSSHTHNTPFMNNPPYK